MKLFLRPFRASFRHAFLCVVLAALCCVFAIPRARAAVLELTPEEKAFVEAHPVVTVSDVDWQPLSIVADGRQQGLFHDYYALIAERTGLAFRFVPLGDGLDFQVVLDALRAKRIDLIDGTGKTADRAEYALFAGPFFRFPLAVASRDDGVAYSLETLAGKNVAVARGSTAEEYLREHAPGLSLVETQDPVAGLTLVATHKAEAAVENMAVAAYAIRKAGLANVKISGVLDYQFEIFSLVRTDWPLLASILQKAHDSVTEGEKAALLAKWLPVYKDGMQGGDRAAEQGERRAPGPSIALTDREREYLARKKALAYCVDPDWAPVERIDENGRHTGISADFLSLMGERLGVPMVLVPTSSWSQSLAAVKARRCDFLPAAGETKDRRRFLRFSSPYLRFPMVVATQAKAPFVNDPGDLAGKSLGVVNGYASLDILRAKYAGIRLMEVPSVSEGLRLVAEGKLFGYIDTVPAISQAMAKDHYSDLKIAGRLDAHLDLAVASRDDEPELASLFQKAVNSLTTEESDAIIKKWVAVTFEQKFDYALLWKVLAGAAVVVAVVVWWNRKLSRLNRALRQAHEALDATNRRLGALLDNAGQGFLSVGPDGLVEPQYSQECRNLFGGDIEGKDVAGLLFPDDPAAGDTMAGNVRRVLDEPDAYRRSLYLSLMPVRVVRGGATLRLAYRPLEDGRLMFVITDITGEIRLKDAVARERNRLACVVAVVREQGDFFTVLDAFAAFRRDGGAGAADAPDGRAALDAVYRQVHTLKGLFLQLECAHVARALDDMEGRLAALRQAGGADRAGLAAVLADTAVDAALAEDLEVVREALGPEFFTRRGEVCLGGELADALSGVAERLLARLGGEGLSPADAAVLEAARALRFVDLRKLLSAYPRTAARLAASRGKSLVPFDVEGESLPVDPARFGPLAKSLIHVFRNAVDHGLETPAERTAAGKDPAGRISCRVAAEDGRVRIEVADDGRGVDIGAIRARAFELGLGGAEELAAMDDAAILDLVFRDGFTSRRVAGELSGRGVGLSAVRAEAERLGGRVFLENRPDRGTRLVVDVPLGRLDASLEKV
jgi:ABC-type amino acid transport substrate-binding protein/signal transduction histidine kinase